jgi:eukaryotic-like serine/threonine-protein kinase
MEAKVTKRLRADPAERAVLETPETIAGYPVIRIIGAGGFGTVYEIVRDDERVALKLLNLDMLSEESVRRFLQEISALRRVRHRNVIRLIDSGQLPDGRPFLVTELLEGVDLQTHLAEHGPLPPREARAILAPLCDALAFCHAHGIVHRDIKASNVFLAGDRVVLLDFGIAKLVDRPMFRTTERKLVGTPSCISPEQLTNGKVDERTDVYLTGVLLYEMLTGMPPFAIEPVSTLQAMHLSAARPRPSDVVSVPRALDHVVMRAMSIAPIGRYPGPRQLAQAFDAALGAHAESAADEVDAIGLLIEATPASASDEELDAAERALELATGLLEAAHFVTALRMGNMAVLLAPVGEDAVDAVERMSQTLSALPATARALLDIHVRRGTVVMVDGEVSGGPLLEPGAWLRH